MMAKYRDSSSRRLWRRRVFWPILIGGMLVGSVVAGLVWSRRTPPPAVISDESRTPRGIWCKQDACMFWDESGARWGQTGPSVGPLLLLVRDERTDEGDRPRMLAGILAAVDGVGALGLHARSVTLPDAEPGGIRVALTGKYDLLVDALGDVIDQLATLEVLLADKAKDPTFRPIYIDLRTPGRIYYK